MPINISGSICFIIFSFIEFSLLTNNKEIKLNYYFMGIINI